MRFEFNYNLQTLYMSNVIRKLIPIIYATVSVKFVRSYLLKLNVHFHEMQIKVCVL